MLVWFLSTRQVKKEKIVWADRIALRSGEGNHQVWLGNICLNHKTVNLER